MNVLMQLVGMALGVLVAMRWPRSCVVVAITVFTLGACAEAMHGHAAGCAATVGCAAVLIAQALVVTITARSSTTKQSR